MKYRVTHTTEYMYDEPVPLCHNLLRLTPRDTPHQRCLESSLIIEPVPAARRERIDGYGNHITWLSIQEPHTTLRIQAMSEVEVFFPSPVEQGTGPWEAAVAQLAPGGDPNLHTVREFTFGSTYAPALPELAEYAKPSFPPGAALLDAVMDLTRRIYHDFTFDTRATTIGTPVLDVLRDGRGVCQDFAHLQIGALRSLGLAARYVSGYLLTHPPEGQKRLIGCDASHAWVSVWIPELGWVDIDPTNGVRCTVEHVTLGWARDYDDISPLRGVLIGSARHWMRYGVDVEPLDLPPTPPPTPPAVEETPEPEPYFNPT